MAVREALEGVGIHVESLRVDAAAYEAYVTAARYGRFRDYYHGRPPAEKMLEHFLAREMLALAPGDVLLDVAASNSPASRIYAELDGVEACVLDRAARPGRGSIRADVTAMPLPAASVSKMTLHCAFEHFEGDADMGFVREASRVLRPSGACCILPLYLAEAYAVQSDPRWAPHVSFEEDAVVHLAPGWGERHGRFYDAAHLQARVVASLGGLEMRIFQVENATDVSPDCYMVWAALLTRP